MAIYSFQENSLQKLEPTTFDSEGILERPHLQAALRQQIDVVAPNCLVISEEFSEWSESQRRIDLLAVDGDANLVVIELKRNETGEQMELQALRYAAMVSKLTFHSTVKIYQKYLDSQNSDRDAENSLLEFLGWEEPQESAFALDVRIVLVASNFSQELTTSVMWLNEKNIDIRCVRLTPYKYQNQLLVDVRHIIPLPEAESYRIKIKQQLEERKEARGLSKDRTKYVYNGNTYNKRKIVLKIIHDWIKYQQPKDIEELKHDFPQQLRSGGLFFPLEDAEYTYGKQGRHRHFLNEDEIIKFQDGTKYAISNQWGKHNIEPFITQARKLGFEIEEKQPQGNEGEPE